MLTRLRIPRSRKGYEALGLDALSDFAEAQIKGRIPSSIYCSVEWVIGGVVGALRSQLAGFGP